MVWKGKCEGALGLGAGGAGGPEKREASAAALAGGGGMSMSAKCGEMASKLVHIFGWRHTYQVQEAQRANHIHDVIVVGHVSAALQSFRREGFQPFGILGKSGIS